MSKVNDDRRSIRTKKMIRLALSELIEEKGFNNISVTDITTRADINRGTFYLHYLDKYDLLEKIENEVIQELNQYVKDFSYEVSVDPPDIIGTITKPMPYMIKIFEYIKENSTFMKAILGSNGDPKFQIKIKDLIKENIFNKKLIKTFNRENMLVPEEFFISYVLSAHLGIIQYWLESGLKKSPQEMTLILSKMFFLGPFKASGLSSIKD